MSTARTTTTARPLAWGPLLLGLLAGLLVIAVISLAIVAETRAESARREQLRRDCAAGGGVLVLDEDGPTECSLPAAAPVAS